MAEPGPRSLKETEADTERAQSSSNQSLDRIDYYSRVAIAVGPGLRNFKFVYLDI